MQWITNLIEARWRLPDCYLTTAWPLHIWKLPDRPLFDDCNEVSQPKLEKKRQFKWMVDEKLAPWELLLQQIYHMNEWRKNFLHKWITNTVCNYQFCSGNANLLVSPKNVMKLQNVTKQICWFYVVNHKMISWKIGITNSMSLNWDCTVHNSNTYLWWHNIEIYIKYLPEFWHDLSAHTLWCQVSSHAAAVSTRYI